MLTSPLDSFPDQPVLQNGFAPLKRAPIPEGIEAALRNWCEQHLTQPAESYRAIRYRLRLGLLFCCTQRVQFRRNGIPEQWLLMPVSATAVRSWRRDANGQIHGAGYAGAWRFGIPGLRMASAGDKGHVLFATRDPAVLKDIDEQCRHYRLGVAASVLEELEKNHRIDASAALSFCSDILEPILARMRWLELSLLRDFFGAATVRSMLSTNTGSAVLALPLRIPPPGRAARAVIQRPAKREPAPVFAGETAAGPHEAG